MENIIIKANQYLVRGSCLISQLLTYCPYIKEPYLMYTIAEYIDKLDVLGSMKVYESTNCCKAYQNRLYHIATDYDLSSNDISKAIRSGYLRSSKRFHHELYNSDEKRSIAFCGSTVFTCLPTRNCIAMFDYDGKSKGIINGFMEPYNCYAYDDRLYVFESLGPSTQIKVTVLKDTNPILFSFDIDSVYIHQDMVIFNDIIYVLVKLRKDIDENVVMLRTFTLDGRLTKEVCIDQHVEVMSYADYEMCMFRERLVISTKSDGMLYFFGLDLKFLFEFGVDQWVECVCCDSNHIYVFTEHQELYIYG